MTDMGGDMPGMGGDMPGMGGDMPGMGGDMPGMGGDMPGMGGDMPGMGGDMPGMGDNMSGMGEGMNGMRMMMMSPFLFTRTQDFFVLFEGAFIQSTGAFIGALLLSGLFALIITIFSMVARIYESRSLHSSSFPRKIAGSALFGLRQTFHYFAMLIVMTMNVWLIIAVVVGHLLGWLIYALALHKAFAVSKDPDAGAKAVKEVDEYGC